jgi:CheY-like chemotaxis protein
MVAAEASSFRILVADDNRDAADSLAQLLEATFPCIVEVAYDGAEVVQKAIAARPNVAILDLGMPRLNGLHAAHEIRVAYPETAPLLIVLTGRADIAEDLAAIDSHFDQAFAKPVDFDRLRAVLAERVSADAQIGPVLKTFDFAELFTLAARQVVPIVLAKRQTFSFDYRGPAAVLEDDPVQLECGLHRLLCGVVDMLETGFVIFTAQALPVDDRACRFVVTAAGTGPLCAAERITEVLQRLQLAEDDESPDMAEAAVRKRSRTAHGLCPNTGGAVEFACSASEGVLFRLELLRTAVEPLQEFDQYDAGAARAWLIDSEDVSSSWLVRRLQRIGWAVTRFGTCPEAASLLRENARRIPRPALVVVVERHDTTRQSAQELGALLHPSTRLVFAVMSGSPTLRAEGTVHGFEVRVYPFSPRELADFTLELAPGLGAPSGETMPMPLGLPDRPLVLVVDDNEVNRIVARGLIEALGFEVATASDGLDAIEQCKRIAPHAVLMDLDMPVLQGLDATRRLRELQRTGSIAPFSIVAATADVGLHTRAKCIEAGMDGYLSKPLSITLLKEELRRVALLQ